MKRLVLVGALVGALGAGAAFAQAATMSQGKKAASTTAAHSSMQAAGEVPTTAMRLGTVHIPRSVKADDQPLKAGTYQVRLSGDPLTAGRRPEPEPRAVGRVPPGRQGEGQGGRLDRPGRSDRARSRRARSRSRTASRVDVLKGDDYVRVWINKGGNNYLIHLPTVS